MENNKIAEIGKHYYSGRDIAFNEEKLEAEAEEIFAEENHEDLLEAKEMFEEKLAMLPRSERRKITNKKIRIKNKKIG